MRKLLLLTLALLLPACENGDENIINGYMEGEYVYIAPSASGVLEEIFIVKGQEIKVGGKLFSIDSKTLQADIDSAKFNLDKAYSNYANLTKGKRPEEILIILKQKDQAEAVLTNAKQEFDRAGKLLEEKYVSKAEYDAKKSVYDQAKGHIDELSANLKTAMLGARDDEIKMAQTEIGMAKQSLIKAQKRFDDSHPASRVNGKIEDVYYRLGEFVTSGSPVVNILPPENIKARFFVSQKLFPKLKLGEKVYINCDGCEAPTRATITFVSSQTEFTPPVIYSVESRGKLVFMIEAAPDKYNSSLHPGLPINIKLE
ncbi:MAG: HlyD family efflux transporter periplasmic adaptor subunit [Lactobacillaceae bacterium]|jgi:HlyD family secretion protein|nr:HlyD family efflux transporter periplasmic adaptor subunit [Lactobacillaceae bacterium]